MGCVLSSSEAKGCPARLNQFCSDSARVRAKNPPRSEAKAETGCTSLPRGGSPQGWFEVAKWAAFCHPPKLRGCPARLNQFCSDRASETYPRAGIRYAGTGPGNINRVLREHSVADLSVVSDVGRHCSFGSVLPNHTQPAGKYLRESAVFT